MSEQLRKGLHSWKSAKETALSEGLGDNSSQPSPVYGMDDTLTDEEPTSTLEFLGRFIRFKPRTNEEFVVNKIKNEIDTFITHFFAETDSAIAFYYKNLEEGQYDVTRMDPLEIERLILSIQKTVYQASDLVAELYNDAYFADRVQQDEYWEAYRQPMSGTKDDRQAYAYQETRDSRWYFYLRYMLWRRLSERLSTLKELQKTVEFHRSRTQKDRF